MSITFDPKAAAQFIAEAHRACAPFENLPAAITPRSIAEAYATQDALRDLWRPLYGEVVGLKIATTTKVMQELLGIDHPCGGMLFEHRIYGSPAKVALGDYVNPMIECELAVRLATGLPARATQYTAAEARAAVGEMMPAFELIEDRNADYRSINALSLIADNVWNAGVVLGTPQQVPPSVELDGINGRLTVNGAAKAAGRTDNPMKALAWLANMGIEYGRALRAGMVVITGSIVPTLPIAPGDHFVFELEGFGCVELSA
jgi:2-keto-4-pentenoate hydratase